MDLHTFEVQGIDQPLHLARKFGTQFKQLATCFAQPLGIVDRAKLFKGHPLGVRSQCFAHAEVRVQYLAHAFGHDQHPQQQGNFARQLEVVVADNPEALGDDLADRGVPQRAA